MKTFWRISGYADLSGAGAKIASARWHTKGKPVVYLAESPAGAMLEHVVHLLFTRWQVPDTYDLLEVQAPEEATMKDLLPQADDLLSLTDVDWKANLLLTRRIGDEWLAGKETPMARIPSAIMPGTWNFLVNPEHPDAGAVRIAAVIRERFDSRLFRLGSR